MADPEKVAAVLQLEAAGALPPDRQAAVDELRRAGQFPAHEVTPDDPIWNAAEQKYGLPGGILRAIQGVESGDRPNASTAESPTHVTGLMQVTLGTGEKYGLTRENRTNPYKSIDVAAQILRDNLAAAGGDVRKAVALYGDHNEKGYADKVLSRWQPPTPGGGVAAPSQAPEPSIGEQIRQAAGTVLPPSDESGPPDPNAANLGPIGALYYRTIGRASANAVALADKYGVGPFGADTFGKQMTAAGLPTPSVAQPQGPLATAGAAMETAQPALSLMSGARGVSAAIYGIPAAVQWLTNDEATADKTELALSTGLLARDVGKIGAAGVRQFQRSRGIFSTAERGYMDATESAKVATEHANATRDAALAAEARQAGAAKAVAEAGEAHDAAVHEMLHADVPGTVPRAVIHEAIGVPPGPTKDMLAETLRSLGEDDPLGEGALATAKRIAKTRQSAYAALERTADTIPAFIPGRSGDADAIRATAMDTLNLIKSSGATVGVKERGLLMAAASLGGVELDPKSMEVLVHGSEDAVIPYSLLSQLHGRIRNLALSPKDFAFSSNVGRKLFSRIGDALDVAMHKVELANPELAEQGRQARMIVRRVEKPFVEQTLRTALRGTGRQAVETIYGNGILKDPTHAKRLLMTDPEPAREKTIGAMWQMLVDSATDPRTDEVNLATLEKNFGKYPPDVRTMMSSLSNTNATAEMDALLARHQKLINWSKDTAARVDEKLGALRLAGKALTKAQRDTEKALRVSAKAYTDAVAAGDLSRAKLTQRTAAGRGGGRGGFLGPGFLAMGAWQLLHGNIMSGAIHTGLGYSYMKRPLTAAESLRTAADTVEGHRLAAALNASLTGWFGQASANQTPAQPPTLP